MRKIITFLAVVGMFSLQSCTVNDATDYVDHDTIPEAFEIKNVNLGRVADNEYNLKSTFQFEVGGNLFDDETVLVYRLTDIVNSNTPVWQLIPRTIYFNNGDVIDYYFDFSKVDFIITARGSFNLLNAPTFINNQTFRVVIMPSVLAKSVNKNDFSEVMSALNLKENQVQQIKF
ncbi:hypothetical protein ACMDB5_14290 [Flavobacterium sp. W1B]|uniref:hypothetical protein n=1 Tax=Flavobacterium sp. W1B TaxID=3394146 RepID=UPI0039BCBA93